MECRERQAKLPLIKEGARECVCERRVTEMTEQVALIGKSKGSVALDAAKAFRQSSFVLRAWFVLLSTTTLVLLVLTVVGGIGAFDM